MNDVVRAGIGFFFVLPALALALSCDLVKSPGRTSHGECAGPCTAEIDLRTGSPDGCGDGGADAGRWERSHAKDGADQYCKAHCDNGACVCELGAYKSIVASQRLGEIMWGPRPCEKTIRTTYTGQCRSPAAAVPVAVPAAASVARVAGGAGGAGVAPGASRASADAGAPATPRVPKPAKGVK